MEWIGIWCRCRLVVCGCVGHWVCMVCGGCMWGMCCGVMVWCGGAGVDMLMVWCCHCSDTPSRALIRLQAEQRCGLGPGQQRQDGGGTAWADALWGWMEAETSLSCAAGLEAMEHARPQDRPGQPARELVSQRAVRARVVCACGTWLRPDGDCGGHPCHCNPGSSTAMDGAGMGWAVGVDGPVRHVLCMDACWARHAGPAD